MAITEREVKNKRNSAGELTGKSGRVYDVNIKFKVGGVQRTYSKKGFPTKKAAQEHEAAMRIKLGCPSYTPPTAAQEKLTVAEYMNKWIEVHGKANLRPNSFDGYKGNIKNHINPHIGQMPLRQVTGETLDLFYSDLSDEGLSQSSVKYVHRILSVAFEHARKYHYIESNPAKDIITRFGKQGKTPPPYTVEQMRELIEQTPDQQWQLMIVLGGLYGLRISEALGLRWRNVDLERKCFSVVEQLPSDFPPETTVITEMAPVKSSERELPITPQTLVYFERQLASQTRQKSEYGKYIENDLVIAQPNGIPKRRQSMSHDFARLLGRLDMPHIRFHDLRHGAATNMHQLTGDFYTVGQILGHSVKGIGNQLNLAANMGSVTAQYIDVRLDRKKVILEAYHNAVFGEMES